MQQAAAADKLQQPAAAADYVHYVHQMLVAADHLNAAAISIRMETQYRG